jgi:hypothetical protein
LIRTLSGSAKAAAAPGNAASTAAAPAATASPAAASATPAATTTAAAAAPRNLNSVAGVFLVEDVERGQTHIGDFLIAKHNLMTKTYGRCLRRIRRRHGCCRCTAYHRKCQTGCPQYRNRFCHVLFLRRLFCTLHSRNLHTCIWFDSSVKSLACDKSPRKAIAHLSLNSPLLTGIWFILMNNIFTFIHRLFINVGSIVAM